MERTQHFLHFLAFGLNTERYKVSLRIQSECGKIRTRITPNTDTFYAVKPLVTCTIKLAGGVLLKKKLKYFELI